MDNRGKPWSTDDDQKLVKSPYISNAVFARSMGRSEYAIACRRNHLAAKMHQADPHATRLEEAVQLLNADFAQASILLTEWEHKRASLCKRSSQPRAPPEAVDWVAASTSQRIETICRVICEEEGRLSSVFNDPQFLPMLIQHYPGFDAYARIVQAQASLPPL